MCEKIAEVYSKKMEREIHAMDEVIVTQGASGAINSYIAAFANKGDEVVLFEPMWSIYMDHVEIAGAISKTVPLRCIDGIWKFNPEELRAALKRPECKIFLFNSPHNPTGKVFTLEEMQIISDILDECPHVIVIYDAVYENLVFDDKKHYYFGSIGNNWDRTISTFSGGKFFSATGWKIGWAIGSKRLIYFGGIIANTIYETFQTSG